MPPPLTLREMHEQILKRMAKRLEPDNGGSEPAHYQALVRLQADYIRWADGPHVSLASGVAVTVCEGVTGRAWGMTHADYVHEAYEAVRTAFNNWKRVKVPTDGLRNKLSTFMNVVDHQLGEFNQTAHKRIDDITNNWNAFKTIVNSATFSDTIGKGDQFALYLAGLELHHRAYALFKPGAFEAEQSFFKQLGAAEQAIQKSQPDAPQLIHKAVNELENLYNIVRNQVDGSPMPSLGTGRSSAFEPQPRHRQRAEVVDAL